MIPVTQPLGTTRRKLGLDELSHVVEMITPEYLCLIGEDELRYFGLEPILSEEDYTALCSLSLSCRALREECQRALMRHVSIEEKDLQELLDFLGAKYQDKFPIRKLTILGEENCIFISTPTNLVDMLIRSPKLEYLCINHVAIPRKALDYLPVPSIHFDRLVTFSYICPYNSPYESGFGAILATMPQLKNLIIRATEVIPDVPRIPVSQLEILMLYELSDRPTVGRWIMSNSFETLHTLHLSWLWDAPGLMNALAPLLEKSGPKLRTLHIWGVDCEPPWIVSLIRACPNLQELGIPLFDSNELYPVPDAMNVNAGIQNHAAALQEQNHVEPTLTCATNLIINALHAPLRRLHIIWERLRYELPPADAFRLPTLCRALQRDHEKLVKLEKLLLVAMLPGEASTPYFNIDGDQGIVAVCRSRGLKLRCSTETDTAEW